MAIISYVSTNDYYQLIDIGHCDNASLEVMYLDKTVFLT